MLDHDIKPEIKVFDLAMLYNPANLVRKGLLKSPPHVQFVLGIANALPVLRSVFDFLRSELAEVMPGATASGSSTSRRASAITPSSVGSSTRTTRADRTASG